MTDPTPTFEQALAELEGVVRDLEEGQLGLDEALTRYERGVALLKLCQGRLREVEQRILLLTSVEADGLPAVQPFQHEATARRLEAPQGESARAERALSGPPAGGSLGLTRIRTHPQRPEAVTVAERATLHRWSLGEAPAVVNGLQAHHPWFSDIAVEPQGKVFAVTTPEQVIELRRWDDLRVCGRVAIPTEGQSGWQALDLSPDGRWLAVAGSYEEVRLLDR